MTRLIDISLKGDQKSGYPLHMLRGFLQTAMAHINWPVVIILASTGLIHGSMLLNDGMATDGRVLHSLLIHDNWTVMSDWFLQASMPLSLYFHALMGYLPNFVFWYRVVALLAIFLAAWLIYLIGHSTGWLSKTESLGIAVLSIAFPAYDVAFVLVRVASALYLVFFLLAIFLVIRSVRATGRLSWSVRISAWLLFLASFTVNSLLVVHGAFLALLVLVLYQYHLRELALKQIMMRLLHYVDFLLLPVVYWALRPLFFPRYGIYADYNSFDLTLGNVLRHTLAYAAVIRVTLQDALNLFLRMPDVLLFLLLFAVGVYTALKLGSNRFTGRANPFWLLVAGVVLLGLCVFPYVVVGKSPTPGGGAGTRHNFLVGYPVAMIIVASIRILFSTANQAISRTGFALFMLLMVAFGVSLNQSYIEWFSRSIYSASVQENLANMPEASDFSLYWVETGPLQLSPHRLNFAEWGSMFKEVWGGETRLIIEQRMYTLEEFLAVVEANPLWSLNGQRVVSDFDPGGCQALLMTQIGHVSYQHASGSNSRSELILRYLYHKFVQGPEATDQFLLDLTDVWVEPIAAPEATNCTTTAPERQQQTIAIYNEILEFKPRWAEAYYRRGLAYLALAQLEQAQADLTQAIELRPNFAPAYYERGMAYMMQGDEASARADYQRVLDLSSDESLIRQAEEQLVQRVPTSGARGDMP